MAAAAPAATAAPATAAAPAPAATKGGAGTGTGTSVTTTGQTEDVKDVPVTYAKEIAELRKLIPAPYAEPDDMVCFRFLKGHKFVMKNASEAIVRTLKWRESLKMDEIRKSAAAMKQMEFPFADKVTRFYPHNISHKTDKFGRPISIELVGMSKPDHMTKFLKLEDLARYYHFYMEHKAEAMKQSSIATGKHVRAVEIMDLSGLGMQHLDTKAIAYFRHVIEFTQAHYPDSLGVLFVINTPWLFKLAWAIVKPWLNEVTLSKIKICNSTEYQAQLLEIIAPENLPAFLGGKCECAGGCIRRVDADDGFTKQVVSYGSAFETKTPIDPAADGLVTLVFRTVKNDIGFAAYYDSNTKGTAPLQLIALKRVDSHVKAIEHEFNLAKLLPANVTGTGTLRFVFSNVHSSWTNKDLLFQITKISKAELQAAAAAQAAAEKPDSDAKSQPATAAAPAAAAAAIPIAVASTAVAAAPAADKPSAGTNAAAAAVNPPSA